MNKHGQTPKMLSTIHRTGTYGVSFAEYLGSSKYIQVQSKHINLTCSAITCSSGGEMHHEIRCSDLMI